MRKYFAEITAVVIVATCSYLVYETVRMKKLINSGSRLSGSAQKFEKPQAGKNDVLVLGDSLAYGVGASKPEHSFAGLLANHYSNKSIKNNAEIGETVASLDQTLDQKLTAHYDQVFIIVGGNDIMRIHINILNSGSALKSLVRKAAQFAGEVTLVSTGNFNYVSLSPLVLKPVFHMRADYIRQTALDLESEVQNFNYVDFYSAPIGADEYFKLEAADGYHLNDQGIKKLISIMLSERM